MICFNSNFDHPDINVVTFVAEDPQKSYSFLHKNMFFFCWKSFCMYLLLDYSHFLVKIVTFFEKLLFDCFTTEKLTKSTPFDCFGEAFVLILK